MPNALHREWKSLTSGSPGSRFQDRYAAAKRASKTGNWTHHLFRVVRLFLAVAAFGVGVVLAFIPGPAVLFFFVAGSLLASESKLVARLLDWSEVRLGALWRWMQRHWKKLSLAGKTAVLTLAAVLAAGAAFGLYRMVAG